MRGPQRAFDPPPFTRPRCCQCGAEFPRHAFFSDEYLWWWYCDEHWEVRPIEHREPIDPPPEA